jgi:hypothetical protein
MMFDYQPTRDPGLACSRLVSLHFHSFDLSKLGVSFLNVIKTPSILVAAGPSRETS